MGKLGNKEVILILIVINFMLYYLLYFIGISPLKNSISNTKADIATLQAEYDEKKAIVDSEETYKQTIETLKAEKAELFKSGFPNTNAESLHAFMVDESAKNNITLSSISISQSVRNAVDDQGVDSLTGIMNNDITMQATGTYDGFIKLLESIEDVQKTSILTSFTLSGSDASNMNANIVYSFLSADKSETPDDIFEHKFGQSAGNSRLYK